MSGTIIGITARNVRPLSIGVTARAHGQNRCVFKQLLDTRALDVHRIDGYRPE